MLQRRLFETEHDDFRSVVRGFIDRSVIPHAQRWAREKVVADDAWIEAGRIGMLGFGIPEEHGGAGINDYRFNTVIAAEFWRAGVPAVGMGFSLHNDIALPYLLELADAEQRDLGLPIW